MTRKRQDYKWPFMSFEDAKVTAPMMNARTAILMAWHCVPDEIAQACAGKRPAVNYMAYDAAQRRVAEHLVRTIMIHCEIEPKKPNPERPMVTRASG